MDADDWTRFLFDDADFDIRREARQWQVRTAHGQAEMTLVDNALAELFPALSNARLGELTVHILDWWMGNHR